MPHKALNIIAHRRGLGGRLNIKIPSHLYRDSHNKDEMVWRPSHLYNGNLTPGNTVIILWRGPVSQPMAAYACPPQLAKFTRPTWGPLVPVGPGWTPCWPHEPCYLGHYNTVVSLYRCRKHRYTHLASRRLPLLYNTLSWLSHKIILCVSFLCK